MATLTKITPCLWFDTEGEEAATFYTSIFENSRVMKVTRTALPDPGLRAP
jgi:predicted 3-demethylubiquinone-9 3-methyltransferase (glyoxalase superfamily)